MKSKNTSIMTLSNTESSASEGKRQNNDGSSNDEDGWSESTGNSPRSSSSGTRSSRSMASGAKGTGDETQFGFEETKAVFRLRAWLFLILLIATTGVSVFVYKLTENAQKAQFKTQFMGSSSVILERFRNILIENLAAISTISVATTAHSVDNNRDWPFVSLSFIQERFAKINEIAGSIFIEFIPLVDGSEKEQWEQFTSHPEARNWIHNGLMYQQLMDLNRFDELTADDPLNESLVGTINMTFDASGGLVQEEKGPGPYMPTWQTSPILRQGLVNKNHFLEPSFIRWSHITMFSQQVVLGGMKTTDAGYSSHPDNKDTRFYATLLSFVANERMMYLGDPMTDVFIPVFDSFNENRTSVAILRAVLHWKSYFEKILPPNIPDITMVLHNSCEGTYTYTIMGNEVVPLSKGDLHDDTFDDMEETASFKGLENIGDGTVSGLTFNQKQCQYSIKVYPTIDFYEEFHDNTPMLMTIAVAAIFLFTTLVFLLYDRLVERRQKLVLRTATQSTAIVSSLFPKNVRDRLLADPAADEKEKYTTPRRRLKQYLGGDEKALSETEHSGRGSKRQHVIADLFPHCTVLFADIVGFTAWSSTRDPSQVFDLLQNIYQSFDEVAKKRRVFKVETIGDCYLAATGLPDPQPDHAIIMAKFAATCRYRLNEITKELEVTLGPDTGELGMRFGMHSGPVTAGVLRGDRSRFQLFGDTVNTAARMESTGVRDKIHVSQSTAELLVVGGKKHWLHPREDTVEAKGKGFLTTFFVQPYTSNGRKQASMHSFLDESDRYNAENSSGHTGSLRSSSSRLGQGALDLKLKRESEEKEGRLIDWAAGLLETHIKRVVARRLENQKSNPRKTQKSIDGEMEHFRARRCSSTNRRRPSSIDVWGPQIPLNEISDFVKMVEYQEYELGDGGKESSRTSHGWHDYLLESEHISLTPEVTIQIKEYVRDVAKMYRKNPFHNFEHACHVTQSVVKLIKRIVETAGDSNQKRDLQPVSSRSVSQSGNNTGWNKPITWVRNPLGKREPSNGAMASQEISYSNKASLESLMEDSTYGIIADPLATLAIIFSALIHDVDHKGISNTQLMVEAEDMSDYYQNRCVAEQNSLDIAWGNLMREKYNALQVCIFDYDDVSVSHFRNVVVNSVLATDIFDKKFMRWRRIRWERAFPLSSYRASGSASSSSSSSAGSLSSSDVLDDTARTGIKGGIDEEKEGSIAILGVDDTDDGELKQQKEQRNLKATIVMEHILQASDVSHTMQHWHIYRRWNALLFRELYQAFNSGRMKANPADFWYQGELGFFDHYVIPLAKKLHDCGIFGVSSDEYLDYALQNRKEWSEKGQEIVQEMISELQGSAKKRHH